MAAGRRNSDVSLGGFVRRPRSALLMSTALQAGVAMVLSLPAEAQPAPNARPVGGVVVAGSAAIGRSATNTAITQSTDRAAVNWQSFDVGSQQSVTFHQPSANSMTLNRVTGPDPSQIAGRIDANGQVVLVNQSGVTFYRGAQVNTAGLMVSAAGISNQNFMAGVMTFDQAAKPDAKVENQGTITVRQAGLAALVAPQVANSGVINAKLGHVVLAGAKTATLDLYGDGLLSLDVSNQVTKAPAGGTALVTNAGTIVADGGTVQLTARAADGIVQTLVQAGGKVRAASMGEQTGTVALNGVGGSIVVEGQLSAPGIAPGTKGGAIEVVTNGNVVVASTARINASGKAGGGVVAVGTTLDRAKGGPTVTPARTAKNVSVKQGATIAADAITNGNGGRVTVLSANTTHMDGLITARGGAQGGNGGFVEVSGKNLGMTGSVDVSAPGGALGTILLDPDFLDVVAGLAGSGDQDPTFVVNGGTIGAADPSIGADTISNGVIDAFNGNVLLQADKTLTVAANIDLKTVPGQKLVLEAGGTITVNAGIGATATGDVILATGGAGPSSPPAAQPSPLISLLGTVSSTSGSVSLLSGAGGTLNIGPTGSVSAASDKLATLQMDTLAVAAGGKVSVPLGTIEIAPASSIAVRLGGTTDLSLSQATLNAMSASTLRLGGATVGGTLTQTASAISIDGTISLSGIASTLDLQSTGAVTESAALSNIGTLTGKTGTVTLTSGLDSGIATIGSYTVTGSGDFSLTEIGGGDVGGPLTANNVTISEVGASAMNVAGAVTATGTVALNSGTITLGTAANVQGTTITLSGAAIALNGNASLGNAGAVVDLTASAGDVIEANTGTIIAATLQSSGGVTGDVRLLGTNAIANLGDFAASGNLLLSDVSALTVPGTISALADVYLQTSNIGGITVAGTGKVAAGSGSLASFKADALGINAGGTITGATFEYAPNSLGSNLKLGSSGALASLTGVGTSNVTIGEVKVPGVGQTTTAGAITVVGTFDAANLPLALVTTGAITGTAAPLINVGTLSGSALSMDLSNASNAIANLGNFSATNSLTLTDSVGLTVSGTVSAPALSLSANSITIPGKLTDGGGGTVNLVATSGTISETGTLIAGTLTGSATGSVSLLGTTPTKNRIVTIGSFSAANFALDDSISLAITGSVAAKILSLSTAGDLVISGTASDGGNGTTTLNASGGMIIETGTLIAGSLTGSAAGLVSLTGAGPTINQVAALSDFDAAGFALRSSTSLTVTGKLTGGSNVTLLDKGTLTIAAGGTVSATVVNMTAGNIAIPGLVSDGGSGTVSLIANTGTIDQTGTLIAGTLSGSAAGAASLLGSGPTINQVATLGAFGAASFALADGRNLLVNGAASATSGNVFLASSGAGGISLAKTGSLAAGAGRLVSFETDRLTIASGGTITGGTIELAPAASDTAVTLGTAGGLLTSLASIGGSLVRIGAVTVPTGVSPTTRAGSITIGGTFDAVNHALELDATGAIDGNAFPLINVSTLTGSGGSAALTNLGNNIATLGSFSATAGNVALVDAGSASGVTVIGPVTGNNVTISDASTGAITVTGSIGTPGTLLLASGSGGIALSGTASIGGATATVDLSTTGGGISEAAGAKITAATLQSGGSVVGSVNLPGSNAIANVGKFAVATGNFSLINTAALGIAGSLAANNVALTAPQITITGGVTAAATLDLIALTNGITETASAQIVADTLESSAGSVGTVALAGTANAIANLGSFLVSGGDFALVDGGSLNVVGGVFADNIGITAVGTGQINVMSGVFAPGGTIALASGSGGVVVGSGGSLFGAALIDIDGGSGGIHLTGAGNIGSSGSGVVDLNTTGGITEAATTTLNAGILQSSLGVSGDVVLPNAAVTNIGDFAVTGGSFTMHDSVGLSVLGALTATASVTIVDAGALKVSGAIGAPVISLNAGAIDIPGLVTDGGSGTVSLIATAGSISETGTLITGTLTGSAIGSASLVGTTGTIPSPNMIATLGDFAAAGFSLSDGRDLNIAGAVTGGPSASIHAENTLTVAGTVAASAVTLSSFNVDIPGLVTDGGAGTVTLIASGGKLAETGTLIAGTLSDNAAFFEDTVDLLGATPTTNQIGTLGFFTATTSFALNDGKSLVIDGPMSGGSVATISVSGQLTIPGSISGGVVNLIANSIAIPGQLVDSSANLIALTGDITATGRLLVNAITGSAAGNADLRGAGPPVDNLVGFLGDFTAANFALSSGLPLTVTGTVNAATVSLTAASISVPGSITGTAHISLAATVGNIGETGSLSTPLLTGSAAGSVSLTGATPGSNHIAALGDFDAASFTLNDGQSLLVGGALGGGSSAVVNDAGILTVGGSITATAVSLNATDIAIPGAVSGLGLVNLVAATGSITDTGTLIAGTLSGAAGGTASFTGPITQVAALGNFTATDLTLNDTTSLTITGAVVAGNVTLHSAASISESGALITNLLTGSSAGDTGLTGATNQVTNLGSFTAGGAFALVDATNLTIGSTLTAPKIVVSTGANQIVFANSATLVTGGNAKPPGSNVTLPTANNSPNGGAFLSGGGFTQQGDSFVAGSTGGANILRVDVTGSGNISFDQVGGLHGRDTWWILGINNGQATGSVFIQALDVVRSGGSGGAQLTGSIGGVTGQPASGAAGIQPGPNPAFRFNGCPIASVSCVLLPTEGIPQGNPLNDIDISTLSHTDEEGDLVLPIVSDQDY